ncbi:MAG: TldD/PmbA family protein [Gemmatimonadetes bacterium]|nr:MAG: TldD/PmbA family protein [Gemmatimonadota bacterium]
MYNPDQILETLERILRLSSADETEILYHEGEGALTRFAENRIHQNVSNRAKQVTIRVYRGKRVGAVTTGKLDESSIQKALQQALAQTTVQQDDPDYVPLPAAQTYAPKPPQFDDHTAVCEPEERAQVVIQALERAKAENVVASGIFSTQWGVTALVNSKGVRAFHSRTDAEFATTMTSVQDTTGWARDHNSYLAHLDPVTVTERAIQKAKDGMNGTVLEPGTYTVILEPEAVANLGSFLSWLGLGAQAFLEGRSFMSGNLGQPVMGENITIEDNVFHDAFASPPFDYEGMPKKQVTLIENGVAKGVVYDLITAKRARTQSTGHAMPKPNTFGPFPSNIVIHGGEQTLDEMIASTERGILVTHFHYNRVVHPMKVILTGLTRDGAFLIENGKVTCGIKNMRYNQSVLEAFRNVEMMSASVPCGTSIICPAMKIHNFNFSAVAGS